MLIDKTEKQMKSHFLFLLIPLVFFNCTKTITDVDVYVGTYTTGNSEGIYKFNFNTETGVLSDLKLVAKNSNPSFLSFSPNKEFLYAVNETKGGSVSAFKVEQDSLTFLNLVKSNGAHPCHISVNPNGSQAVVSNYSGGSVSIHNIGNDGVIRKATQVFKHRTDSILSHVHSAQFFNDNLYVSDLGKNAVYQYQLENDTYQLKKESLVELPKNAGPRHFAMTKDGSFIYIINEYASSITAAEKTDTGFKIIDNYSTLSANYSGANSCADIHLSEDERFLYASNRGENSIAVFGRGFLTGQLEKIQSINVEGNWPRNFTLDPTGKFLLVANERSNNISVFKVDFDSGKLSFLNTTKIPTPVCLIF